MLNLRSFGNFSCEFIVHAITPLTNRFRVYQFTIVAQFQGLRFILYNRQSVDIREMCAQYICNVGK